MVFFVPSFVCFWLAAIKLQLMQTWKYFTQCIIILLEHFSLSWTKVKCTFSTVSCFFPSHKNKRNDVRCFETVKNAHNLIFLVGQNDKIGSIIIMRQLSESLNYVFVFPSLFCYSEMLPDYREGAEEKLSINIFTWCMSCRITFVTRCRWNHSYNFELVTASSLPLIFRHATSRPCMCCAFSNTRISTCKVIIWKPCKAFHFSTS